MKMFKVLIVDDEPLVRLAIKSLVDWETQGFIIDWEAGNGKQALNILRENSDIDIVITDISMPVMDGLTLIKEIQKLGLAPEILVLSAYNDYNLVRQAFKLGVNDYILKTEMNPDNLIKLLNGLACQSEEKKRHEASLQEQGFPELRILKERVLKDLLEGAQIYSNEQIGKLGLRLAEKNLVVCFLWVDDYRLVIERYDQHALKSFVSMINNAVYQVLDSIGLGEAVSLSPQEHVVLLSFKNESSFQIREKIMMILGQIKHALSNYLNINVSIGISSVKDGFDRISSIYREAESNARLRFIFGKGRNIFPEDAERLGDNDGGRVTGNTHELLMALREANPERGLGELRKLLDTIVQVKAGKMNRLYPYYMELIFLLANFLHEKEEELTVIAGTGEDLYEKITGFETQAEINAWIENLVKNIFHYLQEKKDVKVNRTVARAQEFITNNYHQDLTLKMVSDYVGLSESHFSNLFAKITGENFIDYLTKLRIEKAKELLSTTNLKIYEIGLQVGYTSIEHFSRVFKKITGISPNSYRS
jgi:Response regulator containing CheY-like receiver domain and AraC-type DNA-binding domain